MGLAGGRPAAGASAWVPRLLLLRRSVPGAGLHGAPAWDRLAQYLAMEVEVPLQSHRNESRLSLELSYEVHRVQHMGRSNIFHCSASVPAPEKMPCDTSCVDPEHRSGAQRSYVCSSTQNTSVSRVSFALTVQERGFGFTPTKHSNRLLAWQLSPACDAWRHAGRSIHASLRECIVPKASDLASVSHLSAEGTHPAETSYADGRHRYALPCNKEGSSRA